MSSSERSFWSLLSVSNFAFVALAVSTVQFWLIPLNLTVGIIALGLAVVPSRNYSELDM